MARPIGETDGAMPWPDPIDGPLPESSRPMMEAAVDAFAERGSHATTTRDIAPRVGLSPAAVYGHGRSKEALLTEISRRGHEAAVELGATAMGGIGGPLGRLQAVVD